MAKLSSLKQSIVDELLVTIRKERVNMENSNYERRLYLMVGVALSKGEPAFAESLLRNFLGKHDLANTLTWINKSPMKSSLNVNDTESFWTEKK